MEYSLPEICSIAFVAVFILLAFLAGIIRLMMALFPHRDDGIDPVIVAGISTTIANAYPGAQVTHIEEEP